MDTEEAKQLLTEFQEWFKNNYGYESFIYAHIILFLIDKADKSIRCANKQYSDSMFDSHIEEINGQKYQISRTKL